MISDGAGERGLKGPKSWGFLRLESVWKRYGIGRYVLAESGLFGATRLGAALRLSSEPALSDALRCAGALVHAFDRPPLGGEPRADFADGRNRQGREVCADGLGVTPCCC